MARRTLVTAAATVLAVAASVGLVAAGPAAAATDRPASAAGLAPGITPPLRVSDVRLTPGTVSLRAAEVVSITEGRLVLASDETTLALRNGSVVVDARAGLVARLSDVAHSGAVVSARTERVPLTAAYRSLRVELAEATPAATVLIRGGRATVLDAAGHVVGRASAVGFSCSGTSAGVTFSPPSATLKVTGELVARLSISPFLQPSLTLEAGAAVSGRVSLGALKVTKQGTFHGTCALTDLPGISLPVPTGLPPIGSVDVTVTPSFIGTLTAVATGAATVTAPVVTGAWSALAGISYSPSHGWSPVFTHSSPAPQVTGPEVTAPARTTAALQLAARLDLGLSVSAVGTTLAGINLAWSQLAANLHGSLAAPVSDLDLGYTGPRYTVGTELSAGLEASAADSALTTLLSWIGLTPPSYNLTLFDRKFPLFSQPVPVVRSADSTVTSAATDVLTATVAGAGNSVWNGATVEFILFPVGAAPASPSGMLVASAKMESGVATARWQPGASIAHGTYVVVAELDPAGFLPFPSPPSAHVTLQ